jgi:Soluble lytic murein transglycosylase and related regulatory proteins (some contain LysM/invasin domains)
MKNPLVILLAALYLAAAVPARAQIVYIPEDVHFKAPKVPEFIEFAGQTWRFDRPDLYERMDRELITFTYSHTNSSLMLKRAEKIFTQVVPILKQQGVPEDLKYLMAIESNLDPKAYSTAGAAGLWQFMRATGQSYGLEVGTEVDERYNIEKATVAACKYLKEAYAKYGDWMTVAASYNAGQGGISKRLADQRQKRATDLFLPTETSRYMFRILTAKYFFEHPEEFGFHFEEDEIYPYLPPRETVSVSGPIPNLTDFAEEHGSTYFHVKEANLWLRSDKLTNKAGKTYKIIIPATQY